MLLQTIEICEGWLGKAPGHECHLWAHMLSFSAKANMADQPEELRQVHSFVLCIISLWRLGQSTGHPENVVSFAFHTLCFRLLAAVELGKDLD